jgi:phosphoribosylformimino-5-aminoimidazole carboxamide ribotide isomerase
VFPLKVIPVIDVLNGVVVHAVKGERSCYQPLKSVLCDSVDPVEVALMFQSLGFKSLYIADLNAIQGEPINLTLYKQIKTKTHLRFMVDAGIDEFRKAKKLFEVGASKIVIGTETLRSLKFVSQTVECFGRNSVVVSIDLKNNKILSASENISSLDVITLARKLMTMGINQIILLDLDRVGTQCGVNFEILKEILSKNFEIQILIGGGLRSLQDLEELRKHGVSAVLLATALHKGRIKVARLQSAGFI